MTSRYAVATLGFLTATQSPCALAGDADRGAYLARTSCSGCHLPGSGTREMMAAPPFEIIARHGNFEPDLLVQLILSPYPRMNFVVSPSDARDIAAYMSSLRK